MGFFLNLDLIFKFKPIFLLFCCTDLDRCTTVLQAQCTIYNIYIVYRRSEKYTTVLRAQCGVQSTHMYTVQEWNSILLYCGDNVAYNMYMFTVHQSTVKYCTYGTVWRTIYKYEQCTGINSILLYCRHSVAYNLYTCTLYRNEQYTTVLRAQCGVKYKYVHCTGMNRILLDCGHSVPHNLFPFHFISGEMRTHAAR